MSNRDKVILAALIGGICLAVFLVYGEVDTNNFCKDKGHDSGIFKEYAYVCIDYTEYPR